MNTRKTIIFVVRIFGILEHVNTGRQWLDQYERKSEPIVQLKISPNSNEKVEMPFETLG